MTYIKRNLYGGLDWHDIKSMWKQLKENGKYEIKHVDELIAKDIKKLLPFLEYEKILLAIKTKTILKFDIQESIILNNGEKGWKNSDSWINPNGTVSYENEGAFDGGKLQVDLSYGWGQVNYDITF